MADVAVRIKTEDPLADEPLRVVEKEQIYRCSLCELTFDDNAEAVEHFLLHSDAKLTKNHCLKCGRQCSSVEEFVQHRRMHAKNRPFQCMICNKRFSNANTLNSHTVKHQNEPTLSCAICDKRFRYRYEMNQHVQMHGDGQRTYECLYCKKQFNGLVSLQRHNQTHLEERRYHCAICGKKFLRPTHYTVHLRVHIGGKKIKCDLCDQLLGNKQSVRRHMKNIHEPKQPKGGVAGELVSANFACEFCSERFQVRKHLNAHRENHELPCPICGKIFRGPARLKRHTDDHGRVLTCTICSMTFSRKHGLEQHMEVVHKNDPPKPCVYCGETLYKHSFKIHMAKHTGAKLYRCEIENCGKEFLHASSYFRHKVSHTGERRYECDVCGKKSLQQGHHIRHIMLHGEPTHFCEICNKKFHFLQGYKRHMRRKHSSEQPFLCELCGEAFSSEPQRTRHMNAAHNIPMKTENENKNPKNLHLQATPDDLLPTPVCAPDVKVHFESQIEEINDDSNMVADDHHFDDDFGSIDGMETNENPIDNVVTNDTINEYFGNEFQNNQVVQMTVDCDQSYMSYANEDDEQDEEEVEDVKVPEKYFCTVCCKKFDDNDAYKVHLEIHSERVELNCSQCNTKFYDKNAYNLHLWYHKSEEPTPCEFCKKSLYKDTFDRHMITHSGKNPFHCKVCGHKCLNAIMYERHMSNKHGEHRKLQCPLCPHSFAKKTHYTRHMKVHSAERMFVCEICKRTFYDFKALKGHMKRIHSLDKPYGCGKCEERFDSESEVEVHAKECAVRARIKNEALNGFGCAHCEARFSDRDQIVKHMETHAEGKEEEEETILYCDTCGKKFTTTALYERHIRVHAEKKPFECEICGNGFLDKKTYRKHVSRHDKSRLFPCTKCERKFTHRYDLRIHLMIHDGQVPFQCGQCQKTFKHSNSLARHMRAHAGIKNYKCKICQKDFLQSGHLNEHMKTHSDGPHHRCTICDRSFKLMLSFKRHMRRTHSSVKPFLCEKCGDGFADENQRDEHAAKHDKEDAEED